MLRGEIAPELSVTWSVPDVEVRWDIKDIIYHPLYNVPDKSLCFVRPPQLSSRPGIVGSIFTPNRCDAEVSVIVTPTRPLDIVKSGWKNAR